MEFLKIQERKRQHLLTAVCRQEEQGLTFDEELALAEESSFRGDWEVAEVHLVTALHRLRAESLSYPRWARWTMTHVHLRLSEGRPDLALKVLRFTLDDMVKREGPEHPVTQRFGYDLIKLERALACGEMAALVRMNEVQPGKSGVVSVDHLRLVEDMARHYHSWSRCLDVAKACLEQGQLYWVEVACRAAQRLSGGVSTLSHMESVRILCDAYIKAGSPASAEEEVCRALKECQKEPGKVDSVTMFYLRLLVIYLTIQGCQEEVESLRREMNS